MKLRAPQALRRHIGNYQAKMDRSGLGGYNEISFDFQGVAV
jgi:hypothetical protein